MLLCIYSVTMLLFYAVIYVTASILSIAKQLLLMACFIFSLMLIYAVLSFAIMSSFFKADDENHFCTALFQCLVAVTKEGLFNGFGVSYNYTEKDLVTFALFNFNYCTIFICFI